jgi:hypothetical protein
MTSKRFAALLFLVIVLVAAMASTASGANKLLNPPCATLPSSQAFAQWNDYSAYALVPGASFESSNGWSLSGARVTSGNEPFYIHADGDQQSLSLPAGARASAPSMCLGLNDPTLRFVANGSEGGVLHIDLNVRTILGLNLTLPVGNLRGDGTWGPTPVYSINLHNVLSTLQLFAQPKATFKFTSTSGTWSIDDVYVDPLASRCC